MSQYVRWPSTGGGGGGSGSVTSVGLALPTSVFSISGSPVTISGTLTGAFIVQNANTVFAGPASGVATAPTFRSLGVADIPTLPYLSTTLGTANGLSVSGSTLSLGTASTSTTGALTSTDWNTFNGKQASGNYITALSGDVVATGPGSASSTIQAGAVTLAKMANLAANSIIGNNTGSAAVPLALTGTQVTAMLNVFTTSLQGLAPASGGGTVNFLRADGSWATPPGGGGSGTVTSVGLADSTGIFNVSGTPVTTSGTLTLSSLQTQTANTFLAAPNGTTGAPTFRTIVPADISNLTNTQLSGSAGVTNANLAVMAAGTVKSNITGSSTTPSDNTPTSILDAAFGNTQGDILYRGASAWTALAPGTSGQTLVSGGASANPSWSSSVTALKAPTVQKFLSTGSQTGILITQANTAVTATAGAVYTNNSNSYTLLNTVASSTGPLFFSGSGAISGNTFTKSSGTGPTTIVWSSTAFEQSLGTYTTPTSPAPLYIRVTMVGGGGGGGGSGTIMTGGLGTIGGMSVFGTALITANGGVGGNNADSGGPGAGGAASLGSGPIGLALGGANGAQGAPANNVAEATGGSGGSSPLGGAGNGNGGGGGAGASAVANTGSGGAGGGTSGTAAFNGAGGGAGGYANAIISSPSATYFYSVGPSGNAGSSGTSGVQGGAGGSGLVLIEEFYQ